MSNSRNRVARTGGQNLAKIIFNLMQAGKLAELPSSEFDPELSFHSAYVKFFVTFATKVLYLTFIDKRERK